MALRPVVRLVGGACWAAQAVLLANLLYLWLLALAALWRRHGPPEAPAGPEALTGQGAGPGDGGPPRVVVLVPAHDEAAALRGLLADLAAQTHPAVRVHVVADHCSDDTAAIARAAGASCLERVTLGRQSTKHLALHDLWEHLRETVAASDRILVLDADHRVPPDFVATLVACRAPVVQATFREDLEAGNAVAALDGISRVVMHQLCESGRLQLGLSATLVGSAMLFDQAVFRRLMALRTQTIVEDREWQLHLAAEGVRVHWTDATYARSEPVDSLATLDRQRGRWLRGRWQLIRRHGLPLLLRGLRRADADLLDKLYDQVQPPRSVMGLGLAGATALGLLPLRVPGLWPAGLLLPMAGAFGVYFLLGLRLAGAPLAAYLALLQAPLLMVRIATVTLVSLVSRRYDRWVPTPHLGLPETGAESRTVTESPGTSEAVATATGREVGRDGHAG